VIASKEEPDVSETLAEAFKQDAIQLHFNANVEKVAHANGVCSRLATVRNQGEALIANANPTRVLLTPLLGLS